MIFGLMLAFTGSVSAQQPIAEFFLSVGVGDGTPAVGQQLIFRPHVRSNSEPNAPAGTKYLTLLFSQNGKPPVSELMQLTPAQSKLLEGKNADKFTITRVENPLPVKKYDGLKVTFFNNNYAFIQVEVIQGSAKKNLGKMKIHLKR